MGSTTERGCTRAASSSEGYQKKTEVQCDDLIAPLGSPHQRPVRSYTLAVLNLGQAFQADVRGVGKAHILNNPAQLAWLFATTAKRKDILVLCVFPKQFQV